MSSIIDKLNSLPRKSMEQLRNKHMSKGDLCKPLEALPGVFDYALPYEWLKMMAKAHSDLGYDLIASTTVWYYPPKMFTGIPVSMCEEVHAVLPEYKFEL